MAKKQDPNDVPKPWSVQDGRCVAYWGKTIFMLSPEGEPGQDYLPHEMDKMVHKVVELLNRWGGSAAVPKKVRDK